MEAGRNGGDATSRYYIENSQGMLSIADGSSRSWSMSLKVMQVINIGTIKIQQLYLEWAFLVAQVVKNPPAIWETWVQPLGWEDPLEKRMATHSSILAWRIPWTV